MSYLDNVTRVIGVLGLSGITLAVVVGVVWAAFKAFSAKWLEAKFAQRLADYQHRQTLQGDAFRSDLALLLDRRSKIHSMEFEIVPMAWQLLAESLSKIGSVTSPVQQYEQTMWMTSVELEDILARWSFKEHEKERVRTASQKERQAIYQGFCDTYRLRDGWDAQVEFNNYIVRNGIFIEPNIRGAFREISDMNFDQLTDFSYLKNEVGPKADKWKEFREKRESIGKKAEALLDTLSVRYWHEAPKAEELA